MITPAYEEVTLVLYVDDVDEFEEMETVLDKYVDNVCDDWAKHHFTPEELAAAGASQDMRIRWMVLNNIEDLIEQEDGDIFAVILDEVYEDDETLPDFIRIELVDSDHVPMSFEDTSDDDDDEDLPWYAEGEEIPPVTMFDDLDDELEDFEDHV